MKHSGKEDTTHSQLGVTVAIHYTHLDRTRNLNKQLFPTILGKERLGQLNLSWSPTFLNGSQDFLSQDLQVQARDAPASRWHCLMQGSSRTETTCASTGAGGPGATSAMSPGVKTHEALRGAPRGTWEMVPWREVTTKRSAVVFDSTGRTSMGNGAWLSSRLTTAQVM